jgi:hypothetical protein
MQNPILQLIQNLVSGDNSILVEVEKMEQKPKLAAEEAELADSLLKIAQKYGKFNEDETGIWAGYIDARENEVAKIGVKCSNCALYEGNGSCKIIKQSVEPNGRCRFAVIPDGVVSGIVDGMIKKVKK